MFPRLLARLPTSPLSHSLARSNSLAGKSFVSKIYILGFHFFARIECRLSGLSRLFLGANLLSPVSVLCVYLSSVLSQKSTFTDNLLGLLSTSIRDCDSAGKNGRVEKERSHSYYRRVAGRRSPRRSPAPIGKRDSGRSILRLIEFNFGGKRNGRRSEQRKVDGRSRSVRNANCLNLRSVDVLKAVQL